MRFRFLASAAVLLPTLSLAQTPSRPRATLPNPATILGFEPGADRKLPSWKQITDYFTALDKASPRVSVRTLGQTTLGRPFLVAFIADSSTLANLEHYRHIQKEPIDPPPRVVGEHDRPNAAGMHILLG